MKSNKDIMDVIFNGESKKILYSLVHRSNPSGPAQGDDDVFEPTISTVFNLFKDLMETYTPDLYLSEWSAITRALEKPYNGIFRLPENILIAKDKLCLSVEDLSSGYE